MLPGGLHRRSIKLTEYDYSQSNAFFVTICAANRALIFGKVVDGAVIHSEAGEIVTEEWQKTEELRTYLKLDLFVVMPNHFHGILLIEGQKGGTARRAPTKQRFGQPEPDSLPTIIGAFKSAVTKRINILRHAPGAVVWQRNYY